MKNMKLSCTLLFVIVTLNLFSQTLNFDELAGTRTWTEDGHEWSWDASDADSIGTINPHTGTGHGVYIANSQAKLTSDGFLDIHGIWIYSDYIFVDYFAIQGFDEFGVKIYETEFDAVSNAGAYTYLALDWKFVQSISFKCEITAGYEWAPLNLYFDDIDYTYYTKNNTLSFEGERDALSWDEDGQTWAWNNNTWDRIIGGPMPDFSLNLSSGKCAYTIPESHSKLSCGKNIDIHGLYLHTWNWIGITSLNIKGYNEANVLIYTKEVDQPNLLATQPDAPYYADLNWYGVKSILIDYQSADEEDYLWYDDLEYNYSSYIVGRQKVTACNEYTWINGVTYHENTDTSTFVVEGAAANGADSIYVLDLTIINSVEVTDIQTACDSFTWVDGNTYTESNNTATYTFTGGAANGCDSIVSLDLTILPSATGADTRTECDSLTWIDGNTYTESNNTATYTFSGGAANGCDSIVSLDLTILQSATGTDTRTECDSFAWIDGNTYTESNNTATYTISGGAANGCDSMVTLNLTILQSTTGTDTRTECDSFTWIDGNTYTESNNTATYTFSGGAANGCDSVVTLNLTINKTAKGTYNRTDYNSFTWIDGVTYTESNNTATHTIIGGGANGCDSVVSLNLTIIPITTIIDSQTACNLFTWIDGITYTESNNSAKCLVMLDLDITNTAVGTDTRTECDAFTWIDGITYTESNNTATYTIVGGAASGCDSVVTLNLTINSVSDITTSFDGTAITANNTQASYIWLDCNNNYQPIPDETNQLFTPVSNGSYAVQLTENGCVDTSDCVTVTSIGILNNSFPDQINVYPNPTNGNIEIKFGKSHEKLKIRLLSSSSQLIETINAQNAKLIPLEIKEPGGIYFIEITDGKENKAIVKIIKD